MTVVYYMQVSFLDVAIELMNILKKHVDLHVLIEITPHGKNLTILEVDHIPTHKTLVHPSELLTAQSYQCLQSYFNGAASVHFVVHPHRTGFSYTTLQANFRVWKYIKQFKPDVIHFETVGMRVIGMLPFLKAFKNVCITIHDPVPHTGESTWKFTLPRTFFFNMPVNTRFLFYSKFAKAQFEQHYKKIKKPKRVLHMSPYRYLRQLVENTVTGKKHILFFGRLSPYKGIDTLLQAMPTVLQEFPQEQLIIAGKKNAGFELDERIINRYSNNITLMEKHIPNKELACLVQEAKFIVCPYKDATQSGVLMTAFGLHTPVIATNVGAFPEFIEHDVNGLLVHSDEVDELASCIRYALQNDHYQTWRQQIIHTRPEELWGRNTEILLETYAGA